MPILFDREEQPYLRWLRENPEGFVVNVDRARRMPEYPMMHAASHGLISSPEIGSFTTGDYVKVCAGSREALEAFCVREYGRAPTPCRGCL